MSNTVTADTNAKTTGSQRPVKIAVIGAGNVGVSTAHYVSKKIFGARGSEIALIDVAPGRARQVASDLTQAAAYAPYAPRFVGGEDFALLTDADLVIHTAGIARKPGMDRMDLLKTNVKIAKDVSGHTAKRAPNAVVIVVANPLDVISMVCWQETGFPKHRVLGMAGVLDSARYRYFISEKLDIAPQLVQTMVLGGHGDAMVPLSGYSSVSGLRADALIAAADLAAMEKRTCSGGAEIVGYLKTGSAYYAPAASTADMAEAILCGKRRLLPASVLLEGEYGVRGMFLGVPVIIGPTGLEQIIELPLTGEQQAALAASAKMVEEGLAQIAGL